MDRTYLEYCTTDRQREMLEAYIECGGNSDKAAKQLGGSGANIRKVVRLVKQRAGDNTQNVSAEDVDPAKVAELKEQVRLLRLEASRAERDQMTARKVRSEIFKIAESTPEPPDWVIGRPKAGSRPGVPTLFASDWHWGEVVNPDEVGGVNVFDLETAHKRARRLIQRSIVLLRDHVVTPDYPGIVFPLGGDMVTGDIHEELSLTNDLPILPTIVDIVDVLQWCIETLADEFGAVFCPSVTGNHGRMSRKPRAKQRNHTNFDWLIYTLLDNRFAHDSRIQFHIPETADAVYRVYGHRYKLTHGDQFRGGDGMIGPIGPITRGDHKKRSRDTQVGQGYDTLIMGHFHTLMQLERFVVNGSLKGYDEYAYVNNFGFEPARQAMWLTHPKHGITISMPVLLQDQKDKTEDAEWVSWKVTA